MKTEIKPGTPLPWVMGRRVGTPADYVICANKGPVEIAALFHDGTEDNETGQDNGDYIIEACNAYPKLKAEIESLKADLDQWRVMLKVAEAGIKKT